jgi:hypothetical protein
VWTRERGAAQVVGREDPSILVLHRNDTIRRRREEEECGEGVGEKGSNKVTANWHQQLQRIQKVN